MARAWAVGPAPGRLGMLGFGASPRVCWEQPGLGGCTGHRAVPDDLHQRILALLAARPELTVTLAKRVDPTVVEALAGREWTARVRDPNLRARTLLGKDRHLLPDLVVTVDPADSPQEAAPVITLVIECQLNTDRDKYYTWVEYLAAARRSYGAAARVIVLSPVDEVIVWAHGLFEAEPALRPLLVGRAVMPWIDRPDRALRNPEMALLSAVFHGASEDGLAVVTAAAAALQSLPAKERREYTMLLEDALPEAMMNELRKLTQQEAQAAADEWFRSRAPYQIGHREGLEQGREQGLNKGSNRGWNRASDVRWPWCSNFAGSFHHRRIKQ